jgi:hypothetical protein
LDPEKFSLVKKKPKKKPPQRRMTSDIRIKGFFKARMIEDIGAVIEDKKVNIKDFY